MRAGRLDRRGTLQRATTAPDAAGAPVKTYATVTGASSIACGYEALDPHETAEEGQERVAWSEAKFVLRWTDDFTPRASDRLVVTDHGETRTYDILGVTQPSGTRGRTWELRCRARSDA